MNNTGGILAETNRESKNELKNENVDAKAHDLRSMDGISASTSTYDQTTLLEEYKSKLDKALKNPKNAENLSNKIYNREMIQLVREINKIFHIVSCPMSEEELRQVGIDRGTMPMVKLYHTPAYTKHNNIPKRGTTRAVCVQSNKENINPIKEKSTEPKAQHSGLKERDATSASTPYGAPSNDQTTLLEEYESKLNKALNNPKNAENLSNKIYNREMIQLVRDIIKNFHTVACPLSEEELRQIGIDRTTMPPSVSVNYKKYFVYLAKYSPTELAEYYKNKLDKMLSDPFIAEGISQKFYSRELIQALREVNQIVHFVPCPVAEEKLIELGISLTLVKIKDSKTKNKASGRKNGEKLKEKWNKKSVDLHRCCKPWKPFFFGISKGTSNTVEKKEQITRNIRRILNKICPSNYVELSKEILEKQIWNDLEILPAIIDLIFSKAIEEQIYVEIYANLCLDLFNAEENVAKDQCNFLNAFARKCQIALNEIVGDYEKSFLEFIKKIQKEKNEKKIAKMKENLEEMKVVKKWRSFGFLRFISHLCKVPLLHFQTIQNCINRLITKSQESEALFALMIEFTVFFIGIVGPSIAEKNDKNQISKINHYVAYLEKGKPLLPNRIKFLIMDLADLRENKWKKAFNGPKRMMDFIFEEKQNENDRLAYQEAKGLQGDRHAGKIPNVKL
uniref:MIF4G domain-containing protein n=1 Tax=Panagrolaimus superbus TaxID=310955 RepID=A0A914YR63_9BILA